MIAWLLLFTQVWTPALAQTLPIQVDPGAPGQRPFVSKSQGVPVVNIAPPSAGGVSNNRYLQFNVGPGGVVLNNSGGSSQTQLAGPVTGNPMLGNQRATTILNQVTANNPSRLQGLIEVAGHRANVIVANPAGLTCNGCGFLNANRATLTTGKPILGPDGALQFDVTRGHIGIEGLGLNASNLSRVDLLSRSLELNAGLWAGHLDVVTGTIRVDYGTGAYSVIAGEGSAPAFALDTAALGGMYANSIRLVGTEAGVGVNVGGNLTAMTGALELDVNGELRVRSEGRLQSAQGLQLRATTIANDGTIVAARDLSLVSSGTLTNTGGVSAGSALTFSANRGLSNTGAMSSVGDTTVNASAFSNTGTITAGQRNDGSLGNAELRVTSALVHNTGTLVAGGNARITADAITLDGGKVVAGDLLSLQTAGALSNRGGTAHGRGVEVHAATIVNQGGALTSDTALSLRTGALDNRSGTVAARSALRVQAETIDNRAGKLAADGALTLSGSTLDNRDRGVIAGDTLALGLTQSIDNRGGVLQAQGALDANPAGALNNAAGEIYGKNIDVSAATFDNTGGRIVASGTLAVRAQDLLDNSRGTMAARGEAMLGAQRLTNTGGLIAAQGITLANLGVLDNSGGLLQADGTLGITAGSVLNRDTAPASGASLGIIARHVQIDATSVDNQRGRIGASETLTVSTGAFDNTSGLIGSDGTAGLNVSALNNVAGTVAAGGSLTLKTGALDNTGRIHAGGDLTLDATSLSNHATGEIVARGSNVLNVAGTLANAGLIDGGFTRISANEVTNTGRIYGDRVAIQTPTLKNEPNAVIASRGDLDLGVNTLINREHALIYAGGDMGIGGALDASHRAAGEATLVSNDSATIEVAGNAHITAALLRNRNLHFASETVETGRQSKWYYRFQGSDEIHDGTGMWFCNIVKSICGQTPSFLGEYHERRLLLPSERYPQSRYGPPFDYSNIQGDDLGRRGESAPIGLAYTPAGRGSSGGDADLTITWPATFMYKPDAKIWEVFGIERPSGVREPVGLDQCAPDCAALQAQQAAYDRDLTLYEALNAEIRAFNKDFLNNRMVKDFFYYEVVEITRETRITSSDPGKILVGGDARLAGHVVNDMSQIVAGGTLAVTGGQLDNIGAAGERVTRLVGEAVWTYDSDGRKHSKSPYDAVISSERIDVGLGVTRQNTGAVPTNASPGATAQVPPAQVVRVSMPGGRSISVVTLPPVIPTTSLYRVIGAPNAPYLVETDTRFIGQRSVLSSDFLFQQLNQDPGHVLKRLGDGFYEQSLVAEQIRLGTGQRFVGDYTDNESQYKALMQAGAEFAKKFGLTIGVALSEEQMKHLTSDIVWMVEQTVTLPDGSRQKVLAPQVYLVLKPGDLKGDGTLMAGRDTVIEVSGNVNNSGTLGARQALVVSAENINNTIGTVQGKTVDLAARTDITNVAGLIKGDDVSLSAGRDVNLLATTRSFQAGDVLRGMRGTAVDGVARIDAKNLEVQAGRDINARTAVIRAEGDARLQAGNDINLTTTQTTYSESYYRKPRNSSNLNVTSEIGSQFSAGGDFTMIAGRDVNARAAEVSADGRLSVGAGRDINLQAGQKSSHSYVETYLKKRGFMSSRSRHTREQSDWTESLSTTFTGDMLVMMAGRDVNVTGSNAGAQNDMIVSADRNVNIVTAQNSSTDLYYEKTKKSGFGAMGGLSYGSSQTTRTVDTQRGMNTGSLLGSVEGDVLINAGGSLRVMGSDIIARRGDISLVASDVTIGAVSNTMRQREVFEAKQSGLTVTASSPIIDAAKTGVRMAEKAKKSGNAVMATLAGGTTVLAASNAYDEIKSAEAAARQASLASSPASAGSGANAPTGSPNPDAGVSALDKAGGGSIKISYGNSKSTSTTERSSSTSAGSKVTAGNDLTIIARGAGSDSDITVTGSTLAAGRNAVLKADGDVLLEAAKNLYEEKTRTKSSGASLGISIGTGQQNGIAFEAGMNRSRAKEDGKDNGWTNSSLVAGNTLAIQSGGNTTLSGAAGRADQIIASVGGNLLIESLQDSSRFKSSQSNASVSVSLCIPPLCYGTSSGSLSVGAGYMKSNLDSVTSQAGLWAGDRGFQIDVKGNTSLIGAVIGSSEKAVNDNLNQLATGTLITKDIKNKAEYKAAQASLTLSPSMSKPGLGPPAVAGAYKNATSTTESAISGGTILIRDAVAQRDLTGMTVPETIAKVNRDTSDTLNTLKPIFDKEKIEAGLEIALELQRQAGTFLANRAKEAEAEQTRIGNELAEELQKGKDAGKIARLAKELETASNWAPGGQYRLIATAIMGGISGNISASAVDMVRSSAAAYLQGLGAQQVKAFTASLGDDAAGIAARAALHALVACGGGSVTGSCGASALGAASATVVAALLDKLDKANTAEEREQRINLITSLLAGVAGSLGSDLSALVGSAQLELENNSLALKMGARGIAVCARFPACLSGLAKVGLKEFAEALNSPAFKALVAAKVLQGMSESGAEAAATAELVALLASSSAMVIDKPAGAGAIPGKPSEPPKTDSVLVNPDTSGTVDTTTPGSPAQPVATGERLENPVDSGEQYGDGTLINPIPDVVGPDLIYNVRNADGSPAKVIQTGGRTINSTAAKILNKEFGKNLHAREWGRALEALKRELLLGNDHHGRLLSNGDYQSQTGEWLGNIGEGIH
ncbi:hemagglutinin repeat-containing protein [Bordetella genomosp. 5]|uniref:two-partner secretion domain-containing protein n=1 Tax=Bordetella genomosp. 5 TaxID=1395608 RepID=UPI00148300E7|nr:hemagglutinin repeat-containing protein [Bordetella genomosp. 5]